MHRQRVFVLIMLQQPTRLNAVLSKLIAVYTGARTFIWQRWMVNLALDFNHLGSDDDVTTSKPGIEHEILFAKRIG